MAQEPLTSETLRELALAYAARYATTAAKLRRYLVRKVHARGLAEGLQPDLDALVARLAELGLVDDRSFGEARARTLSRRGMGAGRVRQALGAAGIAAELRIELTEGLDEAAAAAAYARRRRLGRYRAAGPGGTEEARKDMAAMLRAGHRYSVAKAALGRDPEEETTD